MSTSPSRSWGSRNGAREPRIVSAAQATALYAARKNIYPQSVHGTYRRIKWAILVIALGLYYLLPFVRFDRGPNAPHQAVLIDLPSRRFYFFFVEIWPQEVYYITGLLILAALALFLMNSLAGRVWCGYLCPQTVWTDLFLTVERWIEGDRRDRMLKDRQPMTARRFSEKLLKHFSWLMIAWWTGGAWVLYFADAPTLVHDLATFQAPFVAYAWIGILTATTYVFAGHMREQVCIYMCPWPRIQAAMTDENALNVTYRVDRGEPRMSVKKAEQARAHGEAAGDCVDCDQCVAVCPTGVDIRKGLDLGCIQCGLCIDACDTVMSKIGRPARLIAYDTDANIIRRREGKAPVFRLIRARTLFYVAVITIVGGIMLLTLLTRSSLGIAAIHDRNPQFVELSDGTIRNSFTIRLVNKASQGRRFNVSTSGIKNLRIVAEGITSDRPETISVDVGPDQTRELRLHGSLAPSDANAGDIIFAITDPVTGETATARDHFVTPDRERRGN